MAEKENIGLVLHGKNDLRLESIECAPVGPDQVQIAVKMVGICMSDIHFWEHGAIGDFIVREPMVMGHESSGVVSAVGENVSSLKVGDRVAIEPGIPCRRCKVCKSGRYNICKEMRCCATPPVHGSLARYFVHDADFCYKLPERVSFEEAAMLEPLSVAVHATRRAGLQAGSHLLICGAGPIGLMNLLVAKAMGASRVVMTDISDERLNISTKMGADRVVNVSGLSPAEAAQQISDELGGCGEQADCAIECSGSDDGIRTAIFSTAPGGTVVLVGLGAAEIKLPILVALAKEVDLRGVFRYVNCYPLALDLVASGLVDVKQLITHRYSMKTSMEAYKAVRDGAAGLIKVVIDCN